jgi:hypothetical protein
MVGEKLKVTYNPFDANCACIVDADADGHELLHSVPMVTRGEDGFRTDGAAAVIGEEYKRHADTLADTNRKLVKRIAMDASTDEEAEAKRRLKAVPFGGRIKPFKEMQETVLPTVLPRRGTDMVPAVSTRSTPLPVRVLTQFEAAQALRLMGMSLNAELIATLKSQYADGVPEDQLDALHGRLTVRSGLRVVNGGGV